LGPFENYKKKVLLLKLQVSWRYPQTLDLAAKVPETNILVGAYPSEAQNSGSV
jgi:hypothetical protein